MENRPDSTTQIFKFVDYREFLSAFFLEKKSRNPRFSHRAFAQSAGLSSPSYLLMVMQGKRNLSMKTIPKFVQALKLAAKEKKYFEQLVLFNQTEDLETKSKYFAELLAIKAPVKGVRDLERAKFEFLSSWHMVVIYALTDLKDFHADAKWISQRLGGKITTSQAKEAIETLLKLELIETDSIKGFKQTLGAISAADDTKSMAVFRYHQSMIRLAAEALKNQAFSEREMNGVTVAIPKNRLNEIKEKIRAFRKEINQLASSYENPDEVYQLNIQLFPVTVPVGSDGGEKS